jgi:hypothetical protein
MLVDLTQQMKALLQHVKLDAPEQIRRPLRHYPGVRPTRA